MRASPMNKLQYFFRIRNQINLISLPESKKSESTNIFLKNKRIHFIQSTNVFKKSRIQETPTLLTDADSRTNTNLKQLLLN